MFRYLKPCNHILASQRHAIKDIEVYNTSAMKFLMLTPTICQPKPPHQVKKVDAKDEEMFRPVKEEEPNNNSDASY